MTPKKQILVGHFDFGWQNVALKLNDGTGGSFTCAPSSGGVVIIEVGAQDKQVEWFACLCCLMHEAWELAMFQADLRYTPTNRVGIASHADYLFVMTHEQFHACCAKVSEFMLKAVPALSAAFEKWHAPAKTKRKPKPRKKP